MRNIEGKNNSGRFPVVREEFFLKEKNQNNKSEKN
jgi:hypothetical protein